MLFDAAKFFFFFFFKILPVCFFGYFFYFFWMQSGSDSCLKLCGFTKQAVSLLVEVQQPTERLMEQHGRAVGDRD